MVLKIQTGKQILYGERRRSGIRSSYVRGTVKTSADISVLDVYHP